MCVYNPWRNKLGNYCCVEGIWTLIFNQLPFSCVSDRGDTTQCFFLISEPLPSIHFLGIPSGSIKNYLNKWYKNIWGETTVPSRVLYFHRVAHHLNAWITMCGELTYHQTYSGRSRSRTDTGLDTPNSFQNCGHRQLACPSILEQRTGFEPVVPLKGHPLSRRVAINHSANVVAQRMRVELIRVLKPTVLETAYLANGCLCVIINMSNNYVDYNSTMFSDEFYFSEISSISCFFFILLIKNIKIFI